MVLVYTASSVDAETERSEPMCNATQPVPCGLRACPMREHMMHCTRAVGHVQDVHVAVATGDDGGFYIAAVWSANP